MEYDRYKSIPNALRQHRKDNGLSQRAVAKYLGLKDPTWISHWENGNALPSLISAVRLSTLYQTPLEALFSDLVGVIDKEMRVNLNKNP